MRELFFYINSYFFAKNVLVLKTLLIFAQKIYISYQEIYKNVVFKTFLYMEYIWSLKRYN